MNRLSIDFVMYIYNSGSGAEWRDKQVNKQVI